jgi:hypothetical protein
MKYIPFEKIIIQTKLGQPELKSRLINQMEPKVNFRTGHYFSEKEFKPYEGKIEDNTFKINRIIKYRNPFLPRIIGEFKTQYGGGSKIHIKMRIKYLVLVFMIFWSFGPILFFISFSENFINEKNIVPAVLISLIWIVIGYLATYLPFNFERTKSKEFLIELFEIETVKE